MDKESMIFQKNEYGKFFEICRKSTKDRIIILAQASKAKYPYAVWVQSLSEMGSDFQQFYAFYSIYAAVQHFFDYVKQEGYENCH